MTLPIVGSPLTTAGGLYRYQLRDEVDVVGFYQQCPLIRFAGKSDALDEAISKFAMSYARQTEQDHEAFAKSRPAGRIKGEKQASGG